MIQAQRRQLWRESTRADCCCWKAKNWLLHEVAGKKNLSEIPSNCSNSDEKKVARTWSITQTPSPSGRVPVPVLKRTRWWYEGVFSNGVSNNHIFLEDGKRGGEQQMLKLVLLPWSLICARLNLDWALTDCDYARSAPQLSLYRLPYSLTSLHLALQRTLNGVWSEPLDRTDPSWDEVERKWPQNAVTGSLLWEFPVRHVYSQVCCKKAFLFLSSWALN